MSKTLDVLVVESSRRAADGAVAALEAAGHRVHRCHDEASRGFPCQGLLDPGSCPVDGHIDVALAVRHRISPAPTALEDGLRCAIRAGVPVVEEGPEILDPFAPWIARRLDAGDDLVAACADAAQSAFEPLHRNITTRIAALLASVAIAPDDVRCHIDHDGDRLDVHLALPVAVTRGLEQALAVRVLDAVRGTGRTFGAVDVHVHMR
jgi:hypothetical protein